MTSQSDKAARFLDLHSAGSPLLLANAWDLASVRLLDTAGFEALATTSGGHAATLGRLDGSVSREEALAHCAALVAATELPVSADLERGFADDPVGVAETVSLALATGLAGCSIEDSTGQDDEPIFPAQLATERVAAAVLVAHEGPVHFVLTARAENYLHGRPDLADTIARLSAFEEAGADVLYAPGMTDLEEIRQLVVALDAPVNVLVRPGGPTVAELASIGVGRISVGSAFAFAAIGGLMAAVRELREEGTLGWLDQAASGGAAVRAAFGT